MNRFVRDRTIFCAACELMRNHARSMLRLAFSAPQPRRRRGAMLRHGVIVTSALYTAEMGWIKFVHL
jgi:hypothetical protein